MSILESEEVKQCSAQYLSENPDPSQVIHGGKEQDIAQQLRTDMGWLFNEICQYSENMKQNVITEKKNNKLKRSFNPNCSFYK